MRALVRLTLRPWLVRVERALEQQLISADARQSYTLGHVVEGLLRAEPASGSAPTPRRCKCGWMSINDVPGLKNLPPIEGGDTHLQPLNMTPIGTAPPAAETPEA